MYREGTAGNDNIQVYANTVPDPTTGAPAALMETGAYFVFNVFRPNTSAPAVAAGWTQYTYTIPGGAPYSIQNLYIIIKVTDNGAAGANVYIDDFSIDTYPAPQTFNSLALAFQNTSGVQLNSVNNWIIGVNVKTNYEGAFCGPLGALTFTHTGTSNPAGDITAAGASPNVNLWWTGGTPSFSVNASNLPTNAVFCGSYVGPAFPQATFAITPSAAAIASMGGGLHNGNNYFWLTYNVPAGATPGNQLDADFISAVIGGACGTQTCGTSGCALAGSRPIDGNYCVPSYTAGTSWLNGSFTNNDYVRQFRVTCTTPAIDPTFQVMNNDHNDQGPPIGGNDGCANGPGFSTFSAHPPDYQKFAPVLGFTEMGACTNPGFVLPGVPATVTNNLFPAGNCNRTTSFLRDATNPVYHIDVQCGTWGGSNYIAAFIDFNHDFDFNDAGERIFQSTSMNALTTQGVNFTIPAGTYYGPTMMRVREWYAQSNIDACSPGYYGESEDYEVILRPGCSPLYPGWKIWLGYTDDWNLNSNWCGGVPTINDHALIPGKGAQAFNRGPGTYHPVIKSGYLATTRKLVMLNDTVEINAPIPGSLRISDSLSIGVASAINTSALIVDSAYADSAQISNGVTINTANILFRGGQREKSQLMYKTAELTSKGLIQGDLIDSILIPIRQRVSTVPWLNFNISYYYAQNGPNYNTGSGFTGTVTNISVAPINGAYPSGTVYSNPSMLLSGAPYNIPAGGGYIRLKLSSPIIVNTGGAPLIITICWEQGGATTPTSDQTFQTQTVGYKSYMQLYELGNTVPPAPVGCSMVDTAGYGWALAQGAGFVRLTSDFRPNLTFKYRRVYTKFPIQMESNATAPASTAQWANYGDFVPANSIVTFMATSAVPQNIDGPNSTTFDELRINNNVGYVRQNRAATVNDTLWLTNGRLYLNGPNTAPMTLTLNNNSIGAITRTGGFLVSENVAPNYGSIRWKMGSTIGPHTFNFLTTGGTSIPFVYNATGGTSDLTVATYYPSTNPLALLPWPTGVTTINGYNNPLVTNAPNLVKRFWPMTNAGAAPAADLTFGWSSGAPSEVPTNGGGTYMAQRWDNTGSPIPGFTSVGPGWWPPMPGNINSNTVPVGGVNNFDIAWVLGLQPQPLPVSLLNFTAKPVKDKVKLDWVTASESNNAKFTVERTTDASEYVFIDELQSRGPSTSTLNYTTYDNYPKIGLQYYRLKQVDNNGAETLSKLVPVTFGKDAAFEIVTTVTYDDGSFDVVFNYNSDLPYSYKIIDMLGNVVVAKTDMKAVTGSNIINIKTSLASGVYSFMIQNQEATISRKIFRQ
jgi:hypothetical protein